MVYHILDDIGRQVLIQESERDMQLYITATFVCAQTTYGDVSITHTFPVSQSQLEGYRKKKLSPKFDSMSVRATATQSR